MTDELDKLSDQELSEVFAVAVAGFRDIRDSRPWEVTDPPSDPVVRVGIKSGLGWCEVPPFSTSADAVLPYVTKYLTGSLFSHRQEFWRLVQASSAFLVLAWPDCLGLAIIDGRLARVLCLALIRQSRAALESDRGRHRSEHPLGTDEKT